MSPIQFSRHCARGREAEYLAAALESGSTGGGGPFAARCQQILERHLGVAKALLTTSCTHALEMCALLLNTKPGDRVIVPAYTFVSTANAFVLQGGQPVFADIRPDTLNLDETRLEELIESTRPRAIAVVHYGGVGCEMDVIMEIASRRGVPVIEDHAHGPFARYRGHYLGTFGSLAALSFHESKNISCGEGGGLIVNDSAMIDRAEIIRDKGTDRHKFLRGQVDKYTWVDQGSSYQMSDLLAAVLAAQLEVEEQIQAQRRNQWEFYHSQLESWAQKMEVGLPCPPAHCEHNHHIFYLVMPSSSARNAFIDHLKRHDIAAVFHYVPLHLSRMGEQFGGKRGDCPVAERISERLVRLPLHARLTTSDLERVVEAVRAFSPPRETAS